MLDVGCRSSGGFAPLAALHGSLRRLDLVNCSHVPTCLPRLTSLLSLRILDPHNALRGPRASDSWEYGWQGLLRGGQAAASEAEAEEGEEGDAEESRENLLTAWEEYFPEERWEEYSEEEIEDMVLEHRWERRKQREAREEEQAEAEAGAPGLPAGRTLRAALACLTQLTSLELQIDSPGEPLAEWCYSGSLTVECGYSCGSTGRPVPELVADFLAASHWDACAAHYLTGAAAAAAETSHLPLPQAWITCWQRWRACASSAPSTGGVLAAGCRPLRSCPVGPGWAACGIWWRRRRWWHAACRPWRQPSSWSMWGCGVPLAHPLR